MVRNLLFSVVALAFSVSASSQVLRVAPSETNDAALLQQSTASIEAGDNQAWWGYYEDGTNRRALGEFSKNTTLSQAIFIPGDNPLAAGKTIKAVRFFLRDKSAFENVSVWVSTSLPSNPANANVAYIELSGDDLNGGDESRALVGSANDVALETPYAITGNGVYVGYTYTIIKTTSAAKNPIAVSNGADNVAHALYLNMGNGWGDYSGSYGNLSVEVLLEGDFAKNAVTPSDFGIKLLEKGQSVTVPVALTNYGLDGISSIDYVVTTDGVAGAEQHYELAAPFKSVGFSTPLDFTMTAGDQVGRTSYSLQVTKVNGKPNEAETAVANGGVAVVSDEYRTNDRMVLIEEFTTEPCPNCPAAAKAINDYLHDGDNATKAAVICHHSGYYTDSYTTDFDTEYTWFYNDLGSTYAPAMMFDRFTGKNKASNNTSRPSCVKFVNTKNGVKKEVEARLGVGSFSKLDLKAQFNESQSVVYVTVNGERSIDFGDANLCLTLTEDSILTTKQSGASGKYYHMHVGRAVNSTWGEPVEWNDDKFTYTYEFKVGKDWVPEQLKVVAYIYSYNPKDPADCPVDNTAVVTPSEYDPATGISTVADGVKATEVARYTVDGRQIAAPQKGINIVRLSNGKTVKVVVK